jgi:hypothetical protein
MSIEAMKQALEALDSDNPDIQLRAATALRAAIEKAEKYKQDNALGGPAKVFDAIADAIRAGDDYYLTLRRYGYTEVEKHVTGQVRPNCSREKWVDENQLIYSAWRDSEAYQVPMTEEGMRLAGIRFESFRKGWEYYKFYLEHGDVYMKDYLEHGPRCEDK